MTIHGLGIAAIALLFAASPDADGRLAREYPWKGTPFDWQGEAVICHPDDRRVLVCKDWRGLSVICKLDPKGRLDCR